MTIRLSKELEQFVHDAVRAGHYAREDDVIRDALTRLKQTLPEPTQPAAKRTRRGKPATQEVKKPLTIEELHQQMMARGLITQLPNPDEDIDDDDIPIVIERELLSETIIRERR
jgi:Arc/MetJ-type ribon-helix-helix transcriptional regulator